MLRFIQYYGKFQTAKGNVTSLPSWSKPLLFVAAIPGIILVLLSILLFMVSILALLLLTVPVYQLVRVLSGMGKTTPAEVASPIEAPRRHIDVTIVE
ncbi:MAG TPA: hypothetical protein VGG19_00235 [Tepidisphaeraceae bacterium]|jgi:hypothetical protein